MPDEIEIQKLKEENPDFLREGPTKLIELAISDKTASQILEICLKNGVKDEGKIEEIAYYITSVLLSSLPQELLPRALVTNLKIDVDTAKKISDEADQIIFTQAKDDLAKLYKRELSVKPVAKPQKTTPPPEEKLKRPPSKDVYREQVE